MKFLYTVTFLFLLSALPIKQASGQSAELIGGNILNGAVTGTILGTATMGLNNSGDFTALRIGLGAGILGGAGIAIYDVATLPRGHQFFISGTFNDGSNSSIVILLDTVYGSALGAALGSAVMLIGNKSIVDGLQYGASAGAWAGFGFGLIDSFTLSERNRDFVSETTEGRSAFFQLKRESSTFQFLKPDLAAQTVFEDGYMGVEVSPVINVVSFSTRF